MKYFWCSIVEVGKGFFGCCIVKANDQTEALKLARDLCPEIEGEIATWEFPDTADAWAEIFRWGTGKIFRPERSEGYMRLGDFDEKDKAQMVNLADIAHTECLDKMAEGPNRNG